MFNNSSKLRSVLTDTEYDAMPAILPATKAHLTQFKFLRELGKGNSGSVVLVEYTGDDPKILALCDANKLFALKRANENGAENLLAEIQEIKALPFEELNTKTVRCIVPHPCEIEVEPDKTEHVILTKYVGFIENSNRSANPKSQFKSYDLEKFLEKLTDVDTVRTRHSPDTGRPIKSGATIRETHSALSANKEIFLAQIIDGMLSSINGLLESGIVHSDIAPRNFMVEPPVPNSKGEIVKLTVAAGDFGYSGTYDPITGQSSKPLTSGPLNWMDIGTLLNRRSSPRNDLYAHRISLLNILSIELGFKQLAFIDFESSQSPIITALAHAGERIKLDSDSAVLEKYLDNLKKMIAYKEKELEHLQNTLVDSPSKENKIARLRGAINRVKILSEAYKDYLVTLPWASPKAPYNSEEIQINKETLLQANEKFLKLSWDKLKDIRNPDEIQITTTRLLQITVSDNFLNSNFYKTLKFINSDPAAFLNSLEKIEKNIKAFEANKESDFLSSSLLKQVNIYLPQLNKKIQILESIIDQKPNFLSRLFSKYTEQQKVLLNGTLAAQLQTAKKNVKKQLGQLQNLEEKLLEISKTFHMEYDDEILKSYFEEEFLKTRTQYNEIVSKQLLMVQEQIRQLNIADNKIQTQQKWLYDQQVSMENLSELKNFIETTKLKIAPFGQFSEIGDVRQAIFDINKFLEKSKLWQLHLPMNEHDISENKQTQYKDKQDIINKLSDELKFLIQDLTKLEKELKSKENELNSHSPESDFKSFRTTQPASDRNYPQTLSIKAASVVEPIIQEKGIELTTLKAKSTSPTFDPIGLNEKPLSSQLISNKGKNKPINENTLTKVNENEFKVLIPSRNHSHQKTLIEYAVRTVTSQVVSNKYEVVHANKEIRKKTALWLMVQGVETVIMVDPQTNKKEVYKPNLLEKNEIRDKRSQLQRSKEPFEHPAQHLSYVKN